MRRYIIAKFYAKTRQGVFVYCIPSFVNLTWKLPAVDDRALYEVFSNKFKKFGGELLLLTSDALD